MPEQMVVGAEGKKQQKLLIFHCTKSSVGGMGAVLRSEPPGPGPYRDRYAGKGQSSTEAHETSDIRYALPIFVSLRKASSLLDGSSTTPQPGGTGKVNTL